MSKRFVVFTILILLITGVSLPNILSAGEYKGEEESELIAEEEAFFYEDPIIDELKEPLPYNEFSSLDKDMEIETLSELRIGIRTNDDISLASFYHDSIELSGSHGMKIINPLDNSVILSVPPDEKLLMEESIVGVYIPEYNILKPKIVVQPGQEVMSDLYVRGNTLKLWQGIESLFAINKNLSINEIKLNGASVVSNSGISTLSVGAESSSFEETPTITYHGTNRSYRGAFEIDKPRVDRSLILVNLIEMESYLYGVVPREMPALWATEALKVQAVASRSYAYFCAVRSKHAHFDLCNSACCQVYRGKDFEHTRSNNAVDMTYGEFITYNGSVIEALYSSSSGGHTENSESVWSSAVPYLRAVKDPSDGGSGHFINPFNPWTRERTLSDIETNLKNADQDIGTITDIVISKPKTISGRNTEITIYGTKGTAVIDRQSDMRRGVFRTTCPRRYSLPSAKFDFQIYPDGRVIFNGSGFGHGVGMSQYGARGMAEEGYNYQDILKHYYTDVKVEKLY